MIHFKMQFSNPKRMTEIEKKLHELIVVYQNSKPEVPMVQSLYTGYPGFYLFRLYARQYLDEHDPALENELVEFITVTLSNPINWTSFSNGISGIAWFLQHIHTAGFIELEEELFLDFDQVVCESALRDLKAKNHDFMHGGLGNMIYLINRSAKNEQCKTFVKILIKELEELAVQAENGLFWEESEIMLDEHNQTDRIINLHVSHGQAGKMVVLSNALLAGFEEARPVLEKAVQFLCAQENPESGIIAQSIVNGNTNEFVHVGWCRGNISMSLSMHLAANALGDTNLLEKAKAVALNTLKFYTLEKANISDSAFCHGTAGLAHMYLQLYLKMNDSRFKVASDYWMQETLKLAHFKDGLAGFKSFNGPKKAWENDYGLLTGTAGIGLAFITYLSPQINAWDATLLLQ
ncbi:MAG: lantibiotic modifying enzyme [Crocinitomix sp.]|jgi:lantibiotic modifying enzyme